MLLCSLDEIKSNKYLHKLKITLFPLCVVRQFEEDALHIFRDCSYARSFWNLSNLFIKKKIFLFTIQDTRTWICKNYICEAYLSVLTP